MHLFILREENGELRVAVRRSIRHLRDTSSSETSHDDNVSILPSIRHAVRTRSKFSALYRPWVSGTILGIEDFDTAWPGSKWKSIKVKLDKNSPITISNRVSPWEIEPERRSVHVLDFGMKRTRSERGYREEQRQKAAALLTDDSPCFNTEACLNNAKEALRLYHDDSIIQDPSSIIENQIYLCAVDGLIYLSAGSSSCISGAVDNVRTQAQAALDAAMSDLSRTFYGLKLWNTHNSKGLDSIPCPPSLVSNLNSSLALDGPCVSSPSSEPVSLGSDTGASSRDSDLIPAEGHSAWHDVMTRLEEENLELINPKSISVVASIASRMIKAGYKERLKDTFTNLSQVLISEFHALDIDWIFRCCWKVDEVDSSHGEDMSLQHWSSASQFITRVLVEMRRQLHEQNFGAFDELKGEYFAKIVELKGEQL